MPAWNVVDYGYSERIINQLFTWKKEIKPAKNGKYNYDEIPTLLINSKGGSLSDAWAIVDAIQCLDMPVRTIAIGAVESAALLVFTAGTHGHRYVTNHAILMLHHYIWPYSESPDYDKLSNRRVAEDMIQKRIEEFYVKNTKLKGSELKSLLATQTFFEAKQAIKWGFANKRLGE